MTCVVDGAIAKHVFDGHTTEKCLEHTEKRIKTLEQMHAEDSRQLEISQSALNDLGMLLGPVVTVIDAGRRWLAMRAKRAADIARLRNAFGTVDRENHHPLWKSEEEVAAAISAVIAASERRPR
jgi:hypothetical protein